MSEEHSPPIKTWQQQVVDVDAAFIVPIIVIAMLASLASGGAKRSAVADDNEILARIRPVGTVEFAKATGPRVAGGTGVMTRTFVHLAWGLVGK